LAGRWAVLSVLMSDKQLVVMMVVTMVVVRAVMLVC
jgi:hypothetical protein